MMMLRGVGLLLSLASILVLTRALGAHGYGVYSLAIAALTILNVPLGVGLAGILMREVAAGRATNMWSRARGLEQRSRRAIVGLVGTATIAVLVSAIAFSNEIAVYVALACAALCFDTISSLRAAQLRGLGAPILAQSPELILKPAIIACVVFALSAAHPGGISLVAALSAMLAGSVCAAVVGWLALMMKRPSAYASSTQSLDDRSWVPASLTLAGSSLLIVGGAYVDTFVLAVVSDETAVGLYRVAAQVSLAASMAYASINYVVAPLLAYHAARNEHAELARICARHARLATLLCLPVPLVLAATGPGPLLAVFGPQFGAAYAPMMVLLGALVANAACGFGASMLLALKLERFIMIGAAVGALVSGVGTFLLAPHFSATGAAIANACGVLTANAIYIVVLARRARTNPSIFANAEPVWSQ